MFGILPRKFNNNIIIPLVSMKVFISCHALYYAGNNSRFTKNDGDYINGKYRELPKGRSGEMFARKITASHP